MRKLIFGMLLLAVVPVQAQQRRTMTDEEVARIANRIRAELAQERAQERRAPATSLYDRAREAPVTNPYSRIRAELAQERAQERRAPVTSLYDRAREAPVTNPYDIYYREPYPGGYRLNGFNPRTLETWQNTYDRQGVSGYKPDGTYWRFDYQNGSYWDTRGKSCIGYGPTRTCN